jgi:hypothetical protein
MNSVSSHWVLLTSLGELQLLIRYVQAILLA